MSSHGQMQKSNEEIKFLAKLAEDVERYDDMLDCVAAFKESPTELTREERILYATANKHVSGNKRAEIRIMTALEQKEERKGNHSNSSMIKKYRQQVEIELRKICEDVIKTIDDSLFKKASTPETKVYYLKMKADYLRYICEIASEEEYNDLVQKASDVYANAEAIAGSLDPTSATRLGLMLNYSVFYYEFGQDIERACDIAKKTYNEAIAKVNDVKDENFKDFTLITQSLKDNLTLWTMEMNPNDGEKEDQ